MLANKAVRLPFCVTQPDWILKSTEALELFLSKINAWYSSMLLRSPCWCYTSCTSNQKSSVQEGSIPSVSTGTGRSFASSAFSIRSYTAVKVINPERCTAVFITEYINHVLLKHFREDCIKENQSALKKTLPSPPPWNLTSVACISASKF